MRHAALVAALALAGCAGGVIPPASRPPVPAPPPVFRPRPQPAKPPDAAPRPAPAPKPGATQNQGAAIRAGFVAGPGVDALPLTDASARRALGAFRLSCVALVRRTDGSGLTRGDDWRPICDAAANWADRDAVSFFASQFETVQIAGGSAFATGYYEPEIAGSRVRDDAHQVPVYAKPDDLIEVDLGLFSDNLKGKLVRGRVSGTTLVPYFDRAAIEDGAIAGRGLEIAWAADPIEFFFLQVQGSGRLKMLDGSVMRIGYAGQNGRDYVGIGALMRDRGLLGPNQLSMQGIVAWLHDHPDEGHAIMRENRSFVFFRELTGAGPVGALGVPVTGQATIAADPAFVPLGAPVWLSLDRPEATGLWIAQDTGGAIKGANRFDTFWGAGDEARRIAGGMSGRGNALILVPKGTIARLDADAANPQP